MKNFIESKEYPMMHHLNPCDSNLLEENSQFRTKNHQTI